MIATFFGAGESEMFPQRIKECRSRIDPQLAPLTVHSETYRNCLVRHWGGKRRRNLRKRHPGRGHAGPYGLVKLTSSDFKRLIVSSGQRDPSSNGSRSIRTAAVLLIAPAPQ